MEAIDEEVAAGVDEREQMRARLHREECERWQVVKFGGHARGHLEEVA